MPAGQQYASNTAQTTLSSGITNSATTCTVVSAASFPTPPFTIMLDIGTSSQEACDVTNIVGTTFTITRAVDGTSGVPHSNGATVTHSAIARDFREARSHMDAAGTAGGTTVHGLANGSVVVGTTDTQVLTNKTLTSPVVNTPTVASPVTSGTASGTFTSSEVVTHTGTDKDLLVANSVTGNTPLTVNGLTATSVDLMDVKINSVTQAKFGSTGGLTVAPTDTATTPIVANAPTAGADVFRALVNNSMVWKIVNSGNLFSGGPALDISLMTGAKPVVGPQLLAYTPSVGGTGFTVGNGTLVGGYVQYGRQVYVEIYLVFGTTTSLGTGVPTLTLPLTPSNYAYLNGFYSKGPALGTLNTIIGVADTAGLSTMVLGVTGSLSVLSSTSPFTQQSGAVLYLKGTYQSTT